MDIKPLISSVNLKENVIIDCGHIAIFSKDSGYSFGRFGEPSTQEMNTLIIGIELLLHLRKSGHKATLSICLSDLAGITGGNQERSAILNDFKDGIKNPYLPEEYKKALEENSLTVDDVILNLQSKGNEKFKKIIRRVRSNIIKTSEDPANSKNFYKKYNALFLTSDNNDLFSLSTPFLANTNIEDQYFQGGWWKDEDNKIKDSVLSTLPFIRLKKNPIINLYESGGKVLCPATYSGLLSHFDNNVDHIAIYARGDDEFIGEKIIRGVIASNILSDEFSRNCIQVIVSKTGKLEVSIIRENEIKHCKCEYETFTSKISKNISFNNMVVM
ncbi:hypothetical protein [Aeromonas dhakensis]|uniref:hypothetical protein n=1 Tax=Aeromonas dhakensis TaxID=196024 RepID=UPI0034315336